VKAAPSSRRIAFLLAAAFCLAPARAPRAQTDTPPYVNFSFDQVDIRLLVKLVGDITGKRFVVDDTVTGKVTVVTPPQVRADEVYPLFLSILESRGYSVAEREGIHHVVALPERAVAGAPVLGAGEERTVEGVITKVLKIGHVDVLELKKILGPMVRGGKSGALEAFGPTGHLIVTDTADNIARVEKIIAEIDQPGAARVVEVVRLRHASAEDLAAQLTAAIRGTQTAGQAVSRHIQQVAEGGGALPTDVVIAASAKSNSLVLVGTPSQLSELKRIIEAMDVEGESAYSRLNAIFLKYLSAENAAKSLNALLAKTVDKDQRQRIAIEPSEANNALIVDASPQDFELVRSLVERLDQMPQQVMVEILIAEIGVGKTLDLGVEWSAIEAPAEGRNTVVGRSRPDETDAIMDLVTEGVFPQGLSIGVARGTLTDASGNVVPRIPVMLQALAQNRDVNILSNIPLWAQDNTEASVSVVENIPLLRSTVEGGGGTTRDIIQNIDRVDVGIKLKFTPHVNPEGDITMQLNPSIEAIVDAGPDNTQFAPTIAKREVSTTVTIPDRATVVMSGLIREDRVKTVSKVPLLGDLPLLGVLFRSTSDRKQRTNLLIFVTPHVVTGLQDAAAIEKTLESRMGMDVSPEDFSIDEPVRK
jgi:general secretion pathway protein D